MALLALASVGGCTRKETHSRVAKAGEAGEVAGGRGSSGALRAPGGAARHVMFTPPLVNRFAYIPPQCYTKTRDAEASGHGPLSAHNPCFVCHTTSDEPNYVDDGELQLSFKLPRGAVENHWTNLFDPPVGRVARLPDDAVLAAVRASNYFDANGEIALATLLDEPPPALDEDADGAWRGFVPDAYFRFDDEGFDHRPDGSLTGWRAFAYTPFPGTFFPTNGSIDDVLVRLDPRLRQSDEGVWDHEVTVLNLAIVEALIRRVDVPVDRVDERPYGVDLDLDGTLGQATRVAFDAARMHYVGRGRAAERDPRDPLMRAPGLYPRNTEFLHTVRYLDVAADGRVAMATRMKEVRYARKVHWLDDARLREAVGHEALEQSESPDGSHEVLWQIERGIDNGQGWLFQGFIEGASGALRPATYEETAFCAGCHGGIGATTDSTFAFARKLGPGAPSRGWYHPSQHDLRGVPEPKRRDGRWEYTEYLLQNGAGDELRSNGEVRRAFFSESGALRPEAVASLHADVSALVLPSSARALDLDRAYLAIVEEQSFEKGRDAVLAPATNVHARVPLDEPTTVKVAVRYR